MRTLGNMLWHFPFFGFLSAIGVYMVGLLLTMTVVAAPIGLGLMEFGKFLFAPFGSAMVSKTDLNLEQNEAWKVYALIVRILYLPFGLFLSLMAAVQVAFLFCTIVGIPVALVIARSLGTYFNPVNKKCVPRAVAEELERRQDAAEVSKYLGGSGHAGVSGSAPAASAVAQLPAPLLAPLPASLPAQRPPTDPTTADSVSTAGAVPPAAAVPGEGATETKPIDPKLLAMIAGGAVLLLVAYLGYQKYQAYREQKAVDEIEHALQTTEGDTIGEDETDDHGRAHTGPGIVPAAVSASSSFSKDGESYGPNLAFDGDMKTAWHEGAPGPGQGEWIEARFAQPIVLSQISLSTGHDTTNVNGDDVFVRNSHAKLVRFRFDGGRDVVHRVAHDERVLNLTGLDIMASTVRIIFEEVWPGTRWPALPISEIRFEGHVGGQATGTRLAVSEPEMRALIDAWLAAQNAGDLGAYSALYAASFVGIKRAGPRISQFDRRGWLEDRGRMFKKEMTVTVADLRVSAAAQGTLVTFTQTWASGTFKDVGRKELVAIWENGVPRIAREELLQSEIVTATADGSAGSLYVARLGAADHCNKDMDLLRSAAFVVRQDRARFHHQDQFSADPEDGGESRFSDLEARADLAQRVQMTSADARVILERQPLIAVSEDAGGYTLRVLDPGPAFTSCR